MNFLAAIGRLTIAALSEVGRLSLFTWSSVTGIVRPPIYGRLIGQQILSIGYYSLPVVGLTAFFTGGVLALQIAYNFVAQWVITMVGISILTTLYGHYVQKRPLV